jgi:hypothetical protein
MRDRRERRVRCANPLRCLPRYAGASTEQEDAPAPVGRPFEEGWNQVGSGHPAGQGIAQQVRGPHKWLAVAKNKVRLAEDTVQLGVAPGLHKEIDVRRNDIVGTALGYHPLYAINGPGKRHAVEWNAEYVYRPLRIRWVL